MSSNAVYTSRFSAVLCQTNLGKNEVVCIDMEDAGTAPAIPHVNDDDTEERMITTKITSSMETEHMITSSVKLVSRKRVARLSLRSQSEMNVAPEVDRDVNQPRISRYLVKVADNATADGCNLQEVVDHFRNDDHKRVIELLHDKDDPINSPSAVTVFPRRGIIILFYVRHYELHSIHVTL